MSDIKIRGYRLSPQQGRVWRLQQSESAWRFNARGELTIKGKVEAERLRSALMAVVEGNEILRSVFVSVPGMAVPLQGVREASEVLWNEGDVRGLSETQKQQKLAGLKREAEERQWDWTHGPMLAVQVVRVAEEEYHVSVQTPALLGDEAGIRNLIRAWQQSYSNIGTRVTDRKEEENVQYAAVAEWLNENLEDESAESGRQFWRQQEGIGAKGVNLPWTKRPPGAGKVDAAGWRGAVAVEVGEELKRKLGKKAGGQARSFAAWVEASWRALLWRLTGEKRAVVGLVCDGRSAPELAGVIGVLARHVPVTIEVNGSMKFRDLLRSVEQAQEEARDWQDYFSWPESGESQRGLGMCVEHAGEQERPPAGNKTEGRWEIEHAEAEIDRYEWKLVYRDTQEGIKLDLLYDREQWGEAEAARLAANLEAVLSSAAQNPDAEVNELEVVGASERRQLVEEFNHSLLGWQVASQKVLHQRFEEQVAHAGERTALVFEQECCSYRDLNRRANQLAHYLRQQGVGPEMLVGVFLERSVEMVVALLGILKAGGVYLPMDPSYPKERLSFMIQDSNILLLITTRSLSSELPDHQVNVLVLDEMEQVLASQSDGNLKHGGDLNNPAYVIYTSGSTGQPKGVVITHQNVIGLLESTAEQFHFGADDVWTLFHSFAFDFSVWELFGALVHGGRLVVVPFWITRSPEQFYQLLIEQGVTVLNQTPSAFQQLIQSREFSVSKTKIRCVVFGGEAFDPVILQGWWQEPGHQQVQLINMYGITETTVHVTYHAISRNDSELGRSIIGRPISDMQIFILDSNQKLLPAGMTGEIYVGGAGLARGYLARPHLTADRFVPDAFSGVAGQRLYKSGDLARWLRDGTLDYLGRSDHQVKIRGYRVELGEIESALARHPSVSRCVVVLAGKDRRDNYLTAYLQTNGTDVDIEELRTLAKQHLPDYMVPAKWVVLEKLPTLPNGKLDREALPDPATAEAKSSGKPVLPQNSLERAMVTIWQEVLGRQNVGTQDNFFDLGGHSLKAIQIHKQFKDLGLAVNILDLFIYPTIGTLSAFLGGRIAESSLPPSSDQAADRKRRLQNRRETQDNARKQVLEAK